MTPIFKTAILPRFTLCAVLGTTLVATFPARAQNNPPIGDFNGDFAPPTVTFPETAPDNSTTSTNSTTQNEDLDVTFNPNQAPAQSTFGDVAPFPIAPSNTNVTSDESAAWEGFLSGRLAPLNVKFSDLRVGWSSLQVQSAGDKGESAPNRYPDPFFSEVLERFGGMTQNAFTQGRTVRLNNDVFLVVYRAKFPTFEQTNKFFEARFPRNARNASEPSTNEALSAVRAWLDTVPLRASLLNTRNVSAVEDVAAFDFETQFRPIAARIEADMRKSQAQRQSQRSANARSAANVSNRTVVVQAPSMSAQGKPLPPKAASAVKTIPVTREDQMRMIYSAFGMWLEDNDGILPPLENITLARRALTPYLKNPNMWNLPDKTTLQTNARLSKRRATQLQPYQNALILFYSTPDAAGMRTVLRLDGQVRRVKAAEWKNLRTAARLP